MNALFAVSAPNTTALVIGLAGMAYLAFYAVMGWLLCRGSARADEDMLLQQARAQEVAFEDQDGWDWPAPASSDRTAEAVRLILGRVSDQENIGGATR